MSNKRGNFHDTWWVTRPKRELNLVPEELAAFCNIALGKQWRKNRPLHLALEDELETSGTKRRGDRREGSGSGGRTYGAKLFSLGLWFEKDHKVYLTLAGEAILKGANPCPILSKQVLQFQYPSAYGDLQNVKVTARFKIHPFIFVLRLLCDSRLGYITEPEIAFVAAVNAENESEKCYEKVVDMILEYRSSPNGWHIWGDSYLEDHNGASERNLLDVANTIANWLGYTKLVSRDGETITVLEEKLDEVHKIIDAKQRFIEYPVSEDVFQRKYGVDPKHQKDTRNLLNTESVSAKDVEKMRILRYFFAYSSVHPVKKINADIVDIIAEQAGTDPKYTEDVLLRTYPHGAMGGFLSEYQEMAYSGTARATEFELATTELFRDVFGFESKHYGQTGALSTPDVLVISDSEGYQGVIDNKAYVNYSITGDHHNRMVYNYLKGIDSYSISNYPIGFFTYISGGFGSNIDSQIQSIADESGINGSGIRVTNFIAMIEKHEEKPYTHSDIRRIFGLNRQILLEDI